MIISNIIHLVDAIIAALQDRRKRVLVVAVGVANITACNAVGPYNHSPQSTVQLSSLVITDTSHTIESPAVLDPTENNGNFTLSWTQKGDSAYRTTAYLSLDALPDDVSLAVANIRDIPLFHVDVTDPSASYGSDKNPPSSTICIYATDNTINCGSPVDVQAMLTTLPMTVYIVLESCLTSNSKECDYISYPVTLQ